MKGAGTPTFSDTTSEPSGGNTGSGAPVKASMSDGLRRNQGGTVEYICIPPLIFQGVGIFYTFPSAGEMQNAKCKMQNYGIRFTDDSIRAAGTPQFCIQHSAFCIVS